LAARTECVAWPLHVDYIRLYLETNIWRWGAHASGVKVTGVLKSYDFVIYYSFLLLHNCITLFFL